MKVWIFITVFAGLIGCRSGGQPDEGKAFMGSGLKIGEVAQNSAIIWTRITDLPEPVYPGSRFTLESRSEVTKFQKMSARELGAAGRYGNQIPEGATLEESIGAVPGSSGEVRLTYFEIENEASKTITDWQPVDPDRDYTKHFVLDNLNPNTGYRVLVEARKVGSGPATASTKGSFHTAANEEASQKVTFTVATCTKFNTRDAGEKGYHIFNSMLAMEPTFFVHAGDNVYYDHFEPFVTHIDLARYFWNRMYGLAYTRAFLQEVPAYFLKDDHDSWDNDSWPTMASRMGTFTYEQGRVVYDEQVPMSDPRHYRTFRWGKDLQIWLVEVRDFRSPNFHPNGPEKTMWGAEQLNWFRETVQASDATFKFLISPTPLVGPDHLWKAERSDNHADEGWSFEGNLLREFIGEQKNMYIICGDRHWKYISKHPQTGVLEYGTGAASDEHATSMQNPDRSMQLYYEPNRGGFLSVTIDRNNGVPITSIRHHAVMGEVLHEDIRTIEE